MLQWDLSLSNIICREVMVAFGFEKRALKENLIVRWSPQKRRDRVDQILVRELHSEEKEWTDYTYDETIVQEHWCQRIQSQLGNQSAPKCTKRQGA